MSIRPLHTTTDYGELKRRVKDLGLLRPQLGYYGLKTAVTFLILAAAIAIAVVARHPAVLLLDAVFLGFASTQVALLAHDIGHRQAFRGTRTNLMARFFIGNVILGISHSWWNVKHNQHHATPNHVDLDPDIQFPMVVFSVEQIASRARWMRPLIGMQAFVFPLLLPLQALNMRISSVQHLFGGKARRPLLQAFFMVCHVALYGLLLAHVGNWGLALAFFAVHHATFGLYNSSVFASNHKGMPVIAANSPRDFLREQVVTARNLHGHPLTDFWYGGLNYQIEHHLFPTMARNNLSRAQGVVRAFCAERGIPYHATGLIEAYRETFSHLHQVSASLRSRRGALA